MLPALAPLLGEASVELPPLRERDGDVARLARAFWRASAIPDGVVARDGDDSELPTDFLARYEGYEWPGNVRELRAAVIARQTIGPFSRARQRKAERADADALLDAIVDDGLALPDARQRILREFEGRYVVRALARNRTIGRAARAAGMAVRRLGLIAARRARASALDGAGRGSYDLHR
jgi:two-component system response regulator PilR (NtrC family)